MVDKDQPSEQPSAAPAPKAATAARAEEMAKQLRQAVRRSPRWQKGRRLFGFATLVVLVALVAWWLWPRPGPVHVYVIAFDQVAVADQPAHLRIATEPTDPQAKSWGDKDIYFQDAGLLAGANAKPNVITLRTDAKGQVTLERVFPTGVEVANIEVSYVEPESKSPVYHRDKGRVFVWPPKTALLVVELTESLKKASDLPKLAEALRAAGNDGWKAVYLATEPDRPLLYQGLRDWAHEHMGHDAGPTVQLPTEVVLAVSGGGTAGAGAAPADLPAGPVLGRLSYFDGAAADQVRADVLAALKKQFQGTVVRAVVSEKGLTLYVVRSPQADRVVVVPGSWQQLAAALKQAKEE
jgi:hypothetical protein